MLEQELQQIDSEQRAQQTVSSGGVPLSGYDKWKISLIYFGVILLVSGLGYWLYILFFSDVGPLLQLPSSGEQSFDIPSSQDIGGLSDLEKKTQARAMRLQVERARSGDSDGDGVYDVYEFEIQTDPYKADTDGDNINDGDELKLGLDPRKRDSDGDGVSDWIDREN